MKAVGNAPARPEWRDLGFDRLPEGFSSDGIALIEGLNEARGTWSFKGESMDGETASPLEGSLQVMGSSKSGMFPTWQMVWGWPADDPGHAIIDTIMASPGETKLDLMLNRVGPVKKTGAQMTNSRIQPTLFQGTWNLENRPIVWAEADLPAGKDSSIPRQTFEMVVAADGKILIQKSKHMPHGQLAGEGEPANRERMAEQFKAAGWGPLGKAIIYYSPSQPSGAMTTYYYDREAGIACHDTGYW